MKKLWKEKEIKKEDEEELIERFTKAGYNEEEIDKIIKEFSQTGFYKKNGIFGLKSYKSPIIQFIHDDGGIEIIEEARAGIFTMNIEGEKMRYILEPKKMCYFPTANKNEELKGWIVHESEAQAYPVDVVQDAAQFDNICKEFEAVSEFDEWSKGGFLKWLTPQKMIMLLIVGVVAYGLLSQGQVQEALGITKPIITNLTNATVNITLNNTPHITILP